MNLLSDLPRVPPNATRSLRGGVFYVCGASWPTGPPIATWADVGDRVGTPSKVRLTRVGGWKASLTSPPCPPNERFSYPIAQCSRISHHHLVGRTDCVSRGRGGGGKPSALAQGGTEPPVGAESAPNIPRTAGLWNCGISGSAWCTPCNAWTTIDLMADPLPQTVATVAIVP